MIYCISDLHLADRGPRDNFVRREKAFHEFLDHVGDNELIILGDLFEWWQVNLSASVNAYWSLLQRLDNATYIMGNHDSAFFWTPSEAMPNWPTIRNSETFITRQIDGQKVLLMHGHESDPYCHDTNQGIGDITAIISGLLEDRNKGAFRNNKAIEDMFVGTLENVLTLWRKLTGQAGRLEEMIVQVERFREEKGCDAVISGHTHFPGQRGAYYNTGCWCRDEDTYVVIDNGIKVMQWDNGPKELERQL